MSRVEGRGRPGRRLPAVRLPAGRASSRSAGFVLNDERGVVIEVEGAAAAIAAFLRAAGAARRRRWRASSDGGRRPCAAAGRRGVRDRRERARAGGRDAAGVGRRRDVRRLPARAASIPADRRYRYPFVNCTNCGPRFTIVRGVPYDRPLTTMAGFAMCAACRARVRGPARPPLPRPAHRLPGVRAAGGSSAADAAARATTVAAAAALLRAGAIVAVKGLGGYHLACRADDERGGRGAARAQAPRGQAVRADGRRRSRRRARSSRSTPEALALLRSPARPIVLAPRPRRRAGGAAVAPGSRASSA